MAKGVPPSVAIDTLLIQMNFSPPSRVSSAGGGAGSVPAFDTLSDKDSVSLHAHSVTASHVERTLSEVASSLSAPFPRPTGPQA